jgi:hypothetical protein
MLVFANARSASTSDMSDESACFACPMHAVLKKIAEQKIIIGLLIDLSSLYKYYHKKHQDKKQQGPREFSGALSFDYHTAQNRVGVVRLLDAER